MARPNALLNMWQKLSGLPAGKWLFSRLVCFKAPYFASIRPRFDVLQAGRAQVSIKKRRKVQNHIGTVHAIAMCNMAELAAGTMTDVTIPPSHRWIPKGMTVEYVKKAETSLRAIATLDTPADWGSGINLPVQVEVLDTNDQIVLLATVTMWVSAKKA
ncbi:acyl-coenzyme A thioesterase PaaI-like protein [Silvimonas terrae]|uniref:Acyl-coenzyme A thioesterase PaaI-like protein n=1 Tax=Silvimonas terrae TaxID=300266 RepID=A0A840RBS5_9NEIS|nr:hotdog fold domain-containing protein [Silvimonas terrae]MBB5189810.1 acyl-coenzyme A thioesterase PaaI-like protein [Silvimonas terrae]